MAAGTQYFTGFLPRENESDPVVNVSFRNDSVVGLLYRKIKQGIGQADQYVIYAVTSTGHEVGVGRAYSVSEAEQYVAGNFNGYLSR